MLRIKRVFKTRDGKIVHTIEIGQFEPQATERYFESLNTIDPLYDEEWIQILSNNKVLDEFHRE